MMSLVGSVLFIFFVFFVVFFCVPLEASVSGMAILGCHFGFL